MKRTGDTIVVGKNRKRAVWALVMIAVALPVSGWFFYTGLKPGRPGVGWVAALFGLMGLAAFGGYAWMILRTLRSPWHLSVSPRRLHLSTQTYDLEVPWERVTGIAVDEVNQRLGCVLVFDDLDLVLQGATFKKAMVASDAVTTKARMQARMEECFRQRGYHLGIPGHILELGHEALAELLAQARSGGSGLENDEKVEP